MSRSTSKNNLHNSDPAGILLPCLSDRLLLLEMSPSDPFVEDPEFSPAGSPDETGYVQMVSERSRMVLPLFFIFCVAFLIPGCAGEPRPDRNPTASSPVESNQTSDSPSISLSSAQSVLPLTVSGRKIRDRYGRSVRFRGVNIHSIAYRTGKFIHLEDRDLEWMQEHGINLVRLHIFWNHIRSGEEGFDRSYLESIQRVLDRCRQQKMFVSLVFSPVDPSSYHNGHYLPLQIYEKTISQSIDRREETLYEQADRFWGTQKIRQQYREDIGKLFERLKRKRRVIGVNFLRIPLAGAGKTDHLGKELLPTFYHRCVDAFSPHLKDRLVFLTPPNRGLLKRIRLPVVSELQQLVYSIDRVHPLLRLREKYTVTLSRRLKELQQRIENRAKERNRPFLLTGSGSYIRMESGKTYLEDLMEWGVRKGTGWVYWVYSRSGYPTSAVSTRGTSIWPSRVLDCPSPLFVPGTLQSWRAREDRITLEISLSFQFSMTERNLLEIHLPEHAGESFEISESDGNHIDSIKGMIRANRLYLKLEEDVFQEGEEIHLEITVLEAGKSGREGASSR